MRMREKELYFNSGTFPSSFLMHSYPVHFRYKSTLLVHGHIIISFCSYTRILRARKEEKKNLRNTLRKELYGKIDFSIRGGVGSVKEKRTRYTSTIHTPRFRHDGRVSFRYKICAVLDSVANGSHDESCSD